MTLTTQRFPTKFVASSFVGKRAVIERDVNSLTLSTLRMRGYMRVKHQTKLPKERAGAYEVAKLLCDALDKFPANEQDAIIKKYSI